MTQPRLSRYERFKAKRSSIVPPDMKAQFAQSVPYEENGVILYRTEIVTEDPVSEFAKYRVQDFHLNNILAAGATDMLKPTSYNQGLSGLDETIANVSKLDADLTNAQTSQTNN